MAMNQLMPFIGLRPEVLSDEVSRERRRKEDDILCDDNNGGMGHVRGELDGVG